MKNIEIEQFVNSAIGRLVGQSHFSLMRHFANELKNIGLDITGEQCRVLFVLFLEDDRTQQEISTFLYQEKSSTSRLVHSLEEKGYVQRKQDILDERQKRVVLTDKSRNIEKLCLQCAQDTQSAIESKFTKEEWNTLMFLLQKLTKESRAL